MFNTKFTVISILLQILSLKNVIVFSLQTDQIGMWDKAGNYIPIDSTLPELTEEDDKLFEDKLLTIRFRLYTRENPIYGDGILTDNPKSLSKSHWNPKHPTRIVTHGWLNDGFSPSCTIIRDAYLKAGEYNVIIMDWGDVASGLYGTLVQKLPVVAEQVTELINFLEIEGRVNMSTLKCIGHSLGAHVMGIGALYANTKVPMVVGLDPAKPYLESADPSHRIDRIDAKHVQIIHTNAGYLGIERAVGTSDFYPNGGRDQKGCGMIATSLCSHSRAYLYYAESIVNKTGFPARQMSRNTKDPKYRENVYMGGPFLDPNALGIYTLNTASEPPFALGQM